MCLWLPTFTKEFGYTANNSLESMNMLEFPELLQEAEVVNGKMQQRVSTKEK